ncbi:MAG: ABC transporter substrate-binding protein [Deltaproteobacteria bacterium]|jgi:NitT/TauT family transport system substrate-binding protein|nr:ABC transporter substrate-binding protein [Deltaproteobacteria bacterium]
MDSIEKKISVWVFLSIFMFAATGLAAPGKGTEIRIGYLPATGHGKIFIAKERGYFAEEGLQAELIEFINSADGIAAIRAGKTDVGGFGTVAPLLQISTGADLRIIGGLMGEDTSIITTVEKVGGVKSLADLKGKKIATIRLATGDAVLRGGLHRDGLSWKDDVQIFELKSPGAVIEAVKSGQVDAGVVWGPHDVSALAQGLAVALVSADIFPGHPCCRLTVAGDQYAPRLETWQRFLRAILKAERYAFGGGRDHERQVVEDISKYAKLDKALIDKSYYHGRLDQSSDPNADGVKDIWKIIIEAGFVQSKENPDLFIETDAYRQALDSLLAEEPDDPYWKKLKLVFEQRDSGTYGGGRGKS